MVADTTLGDMDVVLSRREREVMECASRGMTNPQIAAKLSVSTHSVKFHLASIYRKLGVANRTEATAHYIAAVADADRAEGS